MCTHLLSLVGMGWTDYVGTMHTWLYTYIIICTPVINLIVCIVNDIS